MSYFCDVNLFVCGGNPVWNCWSDLHSWGFDFVMNPNLKVPYNWNKSAMLLFGYTLPLKFLFDYGFFSLISSWSALIGSFVW
jgi:hypothetical protein